MSKADYQEIIAEYKEQVRVLKEQNNELSDACKAKDAALKRALQKLEYTTDDLDKIQEKNEPEWKFQSTRAHKESNSWKKKHW